MSYLTDIHFKPDSDYHNVRCLNGSAHIKRTNDLTKVTCKKCLDTKTYQRFWIDYFSRRGNEKMNF